MNHDVWYSKFSPDLFSRYFILKEIQKHIFGQKEIDILDVGGKDNALWAFLADENLPYNLTALDILPADERTKDYKYIQGDATQMDFADNTYDCVISTDVLEHIPPEKKANFINECIRVAKDLIIIAAPFDSPITDYVEHSVNNFYKSFTNKDYIWLQEHFEVHKPKRELIENIIKEKELTFSLLENNNLENWILFLPLNFLPMGVEVDQHSVEEINTFFNENLLEMNDFQYPAYRQFYVIFKNPHLQFNVHELFNKPTDLQKVLIFKEKILHFFGKEIKKYHDNLVTATQQLAHTNSAEDAEYLKMLEQDNNELSKKIELLEKDVHELDQQVQRITDRKFFKIWQLYTKIRKILLHSL